MKTILCACLAVAPLLTSCKKESAVPPAPPSPSATAAVPSTVLPGQITILLLGDGYDSSNAGMFMQQSKPAVITAANEVAAIAGAKIVVNTLPLATHNGSSPLGLSYNGYRETCFFDRPADLTDRIDRQAAAQGVQARDFTIVVYGAAPKGGCSKDGIMIVSGNTGTDSIEHEFGHSLGGLYDEGAHTYDDPAYGGNPCIGDHNCSSDFRNLPWTPTATVTAPDSTNDTTAIAAFSGCDGFQTRIYRGMIKCQMNIPGDDFCKVCRTVLQQAIAYQIGTSSVPPQNVCNGTPNTPSIAPPILTSGIFAHVKIESSGVVRISGGKRMRALERPQYVTSDGVAGILVDNKVRTAVPLSERPFFARSYDRTADQFIEERVRVDSSEFDVFIPNITLDQLQTKTVTARLATSKDARKFSVTSQPLLNAIPTFEGNNFSLQMEFQKITIPP